MTALRNPKAPRKRKLFGEENNSIYLSFITPANGQECREAEILSHSIQIGTSKNIANEI